MIAYLKGQVIIGDGVFSCRLRCISTTLATTIAVVIAATASVVAIAALATTRLRLHVVRVRYVQRSHRQDVNIRLCVQLRCISRMWER